MDLLGPTIPLVEESLRFRAARQAALSGNVANADTPGYRPVDLRFEALLGEADARLARTDPRHLPASGGGQAAPGSPYEVVREARGGGPDGNGVDLDQEALRLARNASAFRQQASVLSRLIALTRSAISGDGR